MAYPPVNEDINPYLPVFKCCPDVFPLELFSFEDPDGSFIFIFCVALILKPKDYEGPFFFCEKCRRLGEIVEKEKRGNSNDNLHHLI